MIHNMLDTLDALEAARKVAVPNILKDKLDAGQPVYAFSVKFITNPEIVHYIAAAGYDAILIDMEHGTVQMDVASTMSTSALAIGWVMR
jgi:2-keto-3-deoxy-L-rhamnonate aldolase RhmA